MVVVTKKTMAEALVDRLERGPEFSALPCAVENKPYSPALAAEQYQEWLKSTLWAVKQLVPELDRKPEGA